MSPTVAERWMAYMLKRGDIGELFGFHNLQRNRSISLNLQYFGEGPYQAIKRINGQGKQKTALFIQLALYAGNYSTDSSATS